MSSNKSAEIDEMQAALAEYQAALQVTFSQYIGLTEQVFEARYGKPIHVEAIDGVTQGDCGENIVRHRIHVEVTNGVISKICGFG